MAVKEFLENKYRGKMLTMTPREWDRIKEIANNKNMHVVEVIYMGFEITHNDIKVNGGYNGELYAELAEMHKQKLVASNKHRQAHGQVTAYWLTKKGFKQLNII